VNFNNKNIVGFIGLGVFLILIIEKLFIILSDLSASLLLITDIKLFIILILSYFASLVITLTLFQVIVNKIIKNSENLIIQKTILFFALFYFLIMLIIGTSGTFFSFWISDNFVSEQRYSDYLMYSTKNYFEYSLIKSGTWLLEIVGIVLIIFRKIREN